MRLYIVVFDRPWKTIIVTSDQAEAMTAYRDGPKSERRLMLGWDIINGIEIFQAELPYLVWTAMQPNPIGFSILNSEDVNGLRSLLRNELIKKITQAKSTEFSSISVVSEKAA